MGAVFRCDASVAIGTGHVSRCMTLADHLTAKGIETLFVTREIDVPTSKRISSRGHAVSILAPSIKPLQGNVSHYASLLGAPWEEDAMQTLSALEQTDVSWIVVDHYGLDSRWHLKVREAASRVLVIDDLADRNLNCDLLLDQTLGREEADYRDLVGEGCKFLLGSKYALIRPEFRDWRARARNKRESCTEIRNLLIFLGGTDPANLTCEILHSLENVVFDLHVEVVMGGSAPNLDDVRRAAEIHPLEVKVSIDVTDMARRMVDADIAIGAAGTTTWERCCVGLPTILVSIADNQETIAKNVSSAGAAVLLSSHELMHRDSIARAVERFCSQPELVRKAARCCFDIVDGNGCARVASAMEPW